MTVDWSSAAVAQIGAGGAADHRFQGLANLLIFLGRERLCAWFGCVRNLQKYQQQNKPLLEQRSEASANVSTDAQWSKNWQPTAAAPSPGAVRTEINTRV